MQRFQIDGLHCADRLLHHEVLTACQFVDGCLDDGGLYLQDFDSAGNETVTGVVDVALVGKLAQHMQDAGLGAAR